MVFDDYRAVLSSNTVSPCGDSVSDVEVVLIPVGSLSLRHCVFPYLLLCADDDSPGVRADDAINLEAILLLKLFGSLVRVRTEDSISLEFTHLRLCVKHIFSPHEWICESKGAEVLWWLNGWR